MIFLSYLNYLCKQIFGFRLSITYRLNIAEQLKLKDLIQDYAKLQRLKNDSNII
jgi:hypothetical protein